MSLQTPTAEEIYSGAAAAGARPDPFLTISEWADKYRTLSQRASAEPGPWRTDRTPYLREIMDCLSPSSPTERTVFVKGAQIGGTECGNNWIGYVIHQAPGPMMAVQPTVEMAKRNSKQRVDPLNLKVRGNVTAGNHTVVITALFDRNAASSGYYFYFDYLWPLVPQDVPNAPQEYSDVSLAIDFDTDHGYKKPPAWHVWQLQKLGFKGHADVYMGVFWNNKRQRVGATYPYATVAFSGTPAPGDVMSISISGTTIAHAIGYGETLQEIVSHFRAAINGMFSGVWANDGFGTSTTLLIQSKAPSYTFTGLAVSAPNSLTLTLDDHMGAAGDEGDWEILDSASPVMTEGARKWIRDLAGQFVAAGMTASFAFSMEVYNPPAAMRAKYLRLNGGIVAPGEDVYLDVPSYQMHFGSRVRTYLRQMYRECADEIAAAGLPVVLQFGETQYWYFDNRASDPLGGMPFYDLETINAFAVAKGHQIWPFVSNTDDPAGDPAHTYETAAFLRDRIWSYCQDVIAYVRAAHPAAVFECLWPLDANQGKPAPNAAYRQLLMYVNLPEQWKTSGFGVKYFRCEGFDYDIWQKNATLMRQTITFANKTLRRPAEECMYLAGLYGPPGLEPGTTKNKEARTLPIYGEMVERLRMEKEIRDSKFPTCEHVCQRNGEPIRNFRKSWDTACTAAGLTGLMFHDLRRTAVRNMVRAGIPEKTAMAISGHKTRAVFDRYNIVNDRDLTDAAVRMEQHLKGLGILPGIPGKKEQAKDEGEKPTSRLQ